LDINQGYKNSCS